MDAIGSILTFFFVLLSGLLLYLPVYNNYYDAYGIRLRARKKEAGLSPPPKSSALLAGFSALGKSALTLAPGLLHNREKQLLNEANYRSPHHICTFIGIKASMSISIGSIMLAGSGAEPTRLLLIIPVMLCTWLLPNYFVASAGKQRKTQIVAELPTIVDLLVVCAQAGMSMLLSIDKVSKECRTSCPYLAEELQQVIQSIRSFASPTHIALAEMAERCGVEELLSVVSTLSACEAKGSEMAYPLRQVSLAIRDRIKRKREEESSKVPVKMVPVIMIFIMPLILCPMLGPAILIIIESLKQPISGGH